jgi:hypothetical protein
LNSHYSQGQNLYVLFSRKGAKAAMIDKNIVGVLT